jgi:hypothetical protein
MPSVFPMVGPTYSGMTSSKATAELIIRWERIGGPQLQTRSGWLAEGGQRREGFHLDADHDVDMGQSDWQRSGVDDPCRSGNESQGHESTRMRTAPHLLMLTLHSQSPDLTIRGMQAPRQTQACCEHQRARPRNDRQREQDDPKSRRETSLKADAGPDRRPLHLKTLHHSIRHGLRMTEVDHARSQD